MLHKDAILQINFGYTQLLFMGSVPRINCHLVIFHYSSLYMIVKFPPTNIRNKKQFLRFKRRRPKMELSQISFRSDTTAYQGLHQIKISFNLDLDLWVIITLRCSRLA